MHKAISEMLKLAFIIESRSPWINVRTFTITILKIGASTVKTIEMNTKSQKQHNLSSSMGI